MSAIPWTSVKHVSWNWLSSAGKRSQDLHNVNGQTILFSLPSRPLESTLMFIDTVLEVLRLINTNLGRKRFSGTERHDPFPNESQKVSEKPDFFALHPGLQGKNLLTFQTAGP
jgi:hypothetical protein